MQRSLLIRPLVGLVATLIVGPILATVALAADPVVVVQAGDNLTRLSKRHGVSIATLVDLNNLADPNRIFAGQRLAHRRCRGPGQSGRCSGRRPRREARGRSRPPGRPWPESDHHRSHLWRDRLGHRAGQSHQQPEPHLRRPAPDHPGAAAGRGPASRAAAPAAAPAAKPAAARVHLVARGQNLTTIARTYGVTVSAIVQANRISNPSRIYAGQRLTIPGAAPAAASASPAMPASMATLVAKRDAVRRVIVEEANRYKVPAALALAVAWQESGWRQDVVSHAGAVGVMQLMPATADWVGDAMLGAPVEINDLRHNVRAGVRLLAHYLGHYKGDRDRVLAAYYQGQWAVDHHGIYRVSRPYIASIKVLVRIFGG